LVIDQVIFHFPSIIFHWSLIKSFSIGHFPLVIDRAASSTMENGQWPMTDGKWPMANDRWPMTSGK
jgi:hypothetical protein